MPRLVLPFLWSLFVLLGQGALFAQLPLARLLTVFPPGGKVGSEFEVALSGADLDEANHLHFSHPGITAKQKAGGNGLPEANKFIITIGTNVTTGIYEARVVGRFGISNPRAFVVSDLMETIAPTTNHSSLNAAPIPLGTIVNGHCEANAVNFYRFAAKKGQRVLIECKAKEIDSRMDAALILYDAAGKELQRSRSGNLVDFTPAADGEFQLKLYDFLFRGGGEYYYRLKISTGPHIDFIFPPSGVAGTKSKYLLYGRNLPGGVPAKDLTVQGKPLEQLEVEIELPRDPSRYFSSPQSLADATVDALEYRLSSPQGVSNPVLLSFSTGPLVPEQQPNDQPAQAQSLSPPCEYVGQFYPQGDRDWVSFEAKKGEVFWVEVFSQRLGMATDPLVVIQRASKNDKGEEQVSDVKELNDTDSNIAVVEYKTSTRDPSGWFEAEADGNYRIQVRNLFNTQPDPRLVYRLSVRKEAADFRLVGVAQPPPSPRKEAKEALVWSPLLRRGETLPIQVMAFRRGNFTGEIALSVENLSAGVTCNEAKIEKDKNSAMLLLTASETASSWVGSLKIVGKAKIGQADVAREARGATVNWMVADYNNEAIQSRLSQEFVLAVSGVETAPISIESSERKIWEASEAGKLKIPVKLTRRADFTANLKLKAAGIAAIEKLKEIEVDGKGTNATVEIDLKENKIAPGTHFFYLQTQTTGKYRNNPEAAKAAEDALKQAEKFVEDRKAAVKATADAKQAAVKAAADSAAKAKTADEAVVAIVKAATEAEALAKVFTEKMTAAKTAMEAKPEDQELLTAKESATKAVEEAEAKSKAAQEAKLVAEKTAAEARAKATADAEAQTAAEKAEAEAPVKLKEAEKKKELAANNAKETAKIAEPREVTVTVYSAPINLKIMPASSASAK
jgi:hypothetical protein